MAKMWPTRAVAQKSGINLMQVYRKHGIKLQDYADVCGMKYHSLSMLVKFLIVKLAEVKEGRQTV